jgi:sulfite reductase (NADPH) flavoprotein alpha-component
MTDRVEVESPEVPVFVASSHFGLPEDGATDVIMVGPGTGIAPFRAFLQEREDRECSGRNWLFFGDQHATTDYLYGEEFDALKESGFLHNLSLAFSRDQAEKVYVQHRMLEQGKELWDWMQGGAYFYVCGDASRMAKDVDDALAQIAQDHGGMSEDEAKSWLKQLRKEKRYQRDVY